MTTPAFRPRSSRTKRENKKELWLGALAKVLGAVALILMVAAVFRVAVSGLWEVPGEAEERVVEATEVMTPLTGGGPALARGEEKKVEEVAVPKAVPVVAEGVGTQAVAAAEVSGIERIETKREAIGAALAGFFGAGSVEEKLRWVRDPERVRPLMMDFYASHELKGSKWAGLGWSKSIAEPGFRLGYVEAVFESGEPMALIVEETEDGRVKVDWESSVRYGELPWREFVQVKPAKPTLLRVLASGSGSGSAGFGSENSELMQRLSVRHPSDSEPLEAVFDAKDPDFGSLVEQLESGAWKNVPVTLRLCFPGAESHAEKKMARITAVEGRGWLILPQKRS